MAIKYKSSIDLGGLSILNAALHANSSAPSNPTIGQSYWNTADEKFYTWTGTAWVDNSGDASTYTAGNGIGLTLTGRDLTIYAAPHDGISVDSNGIGLNGYADFTNGRTFYWNAALKRLASSSISDDGTNATANGNLTVVGNLTVQGTLTSIQTTNTEIKDNTILLNEGETGAGVSAGSSGIEIDRGTEGNKTFLWNETDDHWDVGGSLRVETVPTASGVGSVYVQGVNVADVGVIKKMPLADFRAEMGVSNMTLLLEPSSGVQAVGSVWVTKSGNTYTVEHQMGTRFMIAQVYDATDYGTVFVEVKRTGDDTVDVVFGSAVSDGDYYLTLQATAFQSHGDGGDIQDGGGGQL